jgi:hypothetical protein
LKSNKKKKMSRRFSSTSSSVAFALLTHCLISSSSTVSDDLVLSHRIVKLSKLSAERSALAYQEDPSGHGYDTFAFFDNEPDQALVKKNGRLLLGAFRGTTVTLDDWRQNVKVGTKDVCKTGRSKDDQECCSTRTGFYEAYNTVYKDKWEAVMRACVKDCLNPDECVVSTGHSQGGAIAAVAALYLSDLNPYVITFGQPPTVDQPCPLITSERFYRFVNSKHDDVGVHGISYDPVPFLPGLGTDNFGHMIVLASDDTGVAYIGLDSQEHFRPIDAKAQAHSMQATEATDPPRYLDRITAIMKTYSANVTYPVRSTGYVAGTLCSKNKECETGKCEKETTFSYSRCVGVQCTSNADCDSNRCDSGLCLSKLGSCMACNEDSDCAGDQCLQYRCSGQNGLMDISCN